jgi:hypothetical protein
MPSYTFPAASDCLMWHTFPPMSALAQECNAINLLRISRFRYPAAVASAHCQHIGKGTTNTRLWRVLNCAAIADKIAFFMGKL